MKGCVLLKANILNTGGIDPYIQGMNMRRIGIPLSIGLDYSPERGEDFFTDLINGYNNAYGDAADNLSEIIRFESDTDYIFKNLRQHRLMSNFTFDDVKHHTEYLGSVLKTKTIVKCHHKQYGIDFTIYFHERLGTDSSFDKFWHIGFNINHRLGCKMLFADKMHFRVDAVNWIGAKTYQGNELISGWFETSHRGVPHSSSVARLVSNFVAKTTRQLNLKPMEIS